MKAYYTRSGIGSKELTGTYVAHMPPNLQLSHDEYVRRKQWFGWATPYFGAMLSNRVKRKRKEIESSQEGTESSKRKRISRIPL